MLSDETLIVCEETAETAGIYKLVHYTVDGAILFSMDIGVICPFALEEIALNGNRCVAMSYW